MAATKSASAKAEKSDSARKVFDVSKPGKSMPSASAKPIIITHRPMMLHDPMVTGEAANEETDTKTSAPLVVSHELTLKPTSDAVSEPAATEQSNQDETDETVNDPTTSEENTGQLTATHSLVIKPLTEALESQTEASKADEAPQTLINGTDTSNEEPLETSEEREKNTETAPVREHANSDKPPAAVDKQLSPKEQQSADEETAKIAAEHAAAIQKMVETKQYFLPINSIEQRKTKHFVIAGAAIAVILGLAWADIALDAGLIHVSGVKAATHFFSR